MSTPIGHVRMTNPNGTEIFIKPPYSLRGESFENSEGKTIVLSNGKYYLVKETAKEIDALAYTFITESTYAKIKQFSEAYGLTIFEYVTTEFVFGFGLNKEIVERVNFAGNSDVESKLSDVHMNLTLAYREKGITPEHLLPQKEDAISDIVAVDIPKGCCGGAKSEPA